MKAWIQYKHVIMYINYISRLRTSPTDICASAAASTLRKRLQLGLPVPDRGEHQPKDFRRNDDRDLATRTPSVGKMAIPTTKLFNCIAMCGCALPLKARGDIFSVTLPCIARDLRKEGMETSGCDLNLSKIFPRFFHSWQPHAGIGLQVPPFIWFGGPSFDYS